LKEGEKNATISTTALQNMKKKNEKGETTECSRKMERTSRPGKRGRKRTRSERMEKEILSRHIQKGKGKKNWSDPFRKKGGDNLCPKGRKVGGKKEKKDF